MSDFDGTENISILISLYRAVRYGFRNPYEYCDITRTTLK